MTDWPELAIEALLALWFCVYVILNALDEFDVIVDTVFP